MFQVYLRALMVTLLAILLSACNDDKLLINLNQEQANQVLAILQQHNIAATKYGTPKNGYTVTVDGKESTAALSIINQYQLPWPADVEIAQAFPNSSLVASPNAEQARVISMEEQRIAQSLRMISQVVNARVHISYPAFNNDTSGVKPVTHAGVIIIYKGEVDESIFISQIKSLIKNSFDDIRYENISVVLFPAPVIQYVPPTEVPHSLPATWVLIVAVLAIFAVFTSAYMLYRIYLRPPTVKKLNTEEETNEFTEI